jgi:uncharacterized protein (DUF488 family)
MTKHPIYTIGHGTRTIEEFVELLKQFDIQYLIDVRSIPYSKHNPQYIARKLADTLKEYDITYLFMGDALGGRPANSNFYDEKGKVNYDLLRESEAFKHGIKRIETAYEKNVKVALMCSEVKPSECHRSKLIGVVLHELNVEVQHIDENGVLQSQAEIFN